MYSFRDDYSEGCHPSILQALMNSNQSQQLGYGDDEYCEKARQLIKTKIGNPNADVYFASGGTQANLIVITSALRSHEAVVCATTGHIAVHEAGAIEACGHKVITVQKNNGKITPEDVQLILDEHSDVPHMVKPKLVYISNSTEIGTIYSKKELQALYSFCKEKNLYLFLDGARLGSAICAKTNDIQVQDLAQYTDVFYMGGTKNGALLGEAIVINNKELQQDFPYHLKQRGALMAKGRLLGIQFMELFKNDLYFNLAQHANDMAAKLSDALKAKGYTFLTESNTNQIFPIMSNKEIEALSAKYGFFIWKKVDDQHAAIRLVTSWATPVEMIDKFIADLNSIRQ